MTHLHILCKISMQPKNQNCLQHKIHMQEEGQFLLKVGVIVGQTVTHNSIPDPVSGRFKQLSATAKLTTSQTENANDLEDSIVLQRDILNEGSHHFTIIFERVNSLLSFSHQLCASLLAGMLTNQ